MGLWAASFFGWLCVRLVLRSFVGAVLCNTILQQQSLSGYHVQDFIQVFGIVRYRHTEVTWLLSLLQTKTR